MSVYSLHGASGFGSLTLYVHRRLVKFDAYHAYLNFWLEPNAVTRQIQES